MVVYLKLSLQNVINKYWIFLQQQTFVCCIFIKFIQVDSNKPISTHTQPISMEGIRQSERNQIKGRIKELPAVFKSDEMILFIFEAIGTMFLAYGVNATQFLNPTSALIPNPYWTFFVSCFLYFGIAAAAPFTGGHVNPAVTIGVTSSGLCQSRKVLTYIISQLCGAFLGVFIFFSCFGHSAQVYSTEQTTRDIILDGVGQAFGTFIFVFGIIYTCKRNYMKGQYFKYFFIVLMLLLGRTFTFRQGVLNPAVAFGLQLFAAINHENSALLFNIWGLVVGEIVGALLASYFYNNFYEQLLDEVQRESAK